MKRNQRGFGLIELLIIVIMVAVAGIVGYYTYTRIKNRPSQTTNTQVSTPEPEAEPEFKEFVSKEFGFKFEYPSSWGTLKLQQSQVAGKTGKAYELTSDDFSKRISGFITKDWKPKNSTDVVTGFVTYDGCAKGAKDVAQVYLVKSASSCISITAAKETDVLGEGEGFAATIVMKLSLKKSKKIAGIEFSYAPVHISDNKQETIKSAYNADSVSDGFLAVAKSFTEL